MLTMLPAPLSRSDMTHLADALNALSLTNKPSLVRHPCSIIDFDQSSNKREAMPLKDPGHGAMPFRNGPPAPIPVQN